MSAADRQFPVVRVLRLMQISGLVIQWGFFLAAVAVFMMGRQTQAFHLFLGFVGVVLLWKVAAYLFAVRFSSAIKSELNEDTMIAGTDLLPEVGSAFPRDGEVDATRVQAALARIESLPNGCVPWLREAVDEVISSKDAAVRSNVAGRLVRWLYAQAAYSNDDFERRRAYNGLRLALRGL